MSHVNFPSPARSNLRSSDSAATTSSTGATAPTRTVAILAKSCAKVHRLAIESRLTEAGFDILISRQEEWAYPDDSDFLYELLRGHSTKSVHKWIERLTGGNIQFMVLERARAVEAWQELMGLGDQEDQDEGASLDAIDADITVDSIRRSLRASKISNGLPSGPKLRELYGVGLLYGSRSDSQAQRQLAICAPEFASPEAIEDLSMEFAPEADESTSQEVELEVNSNDVAEAGQDGCLVVGESSLVYNEEGEAFDAHTGTKVALEEELVPTASTGGSDAGLVSSDRRVFKARPIPASVANPKIQPRLSRAAALRMGVELPAVPVRKVAAATGPVGISGLPKADVAVPRSLAEPSIKPRANRASMARVGGGDAPDRTSSTSPMRQRKEVDFGNTPGHKRHSIVGAGAIASLGKPTIAPRQNRASLARAGGGPSMPMAPRPSSSATSSSSTSSPSKTTVPAVAAPRPSFNLASLKPPSIAPRSNRAAVARGGIVAGDGSEADAATRSLSPNKENRPRPSRTTSTPAGAGVASTSIPSGSVGAHRPSSPVKAESNRERRPVDFSSTPGHKRATNSFSIAALAAPKIAPRSNLAASRRLSVGGVGPSVAVATGARQVIENGNGNGNGATAAAGPRPSSSMAGRTVAGATATAVRKSARPASSAGVRATTTTPATNGNGGAMSSAAAGLLHQQPLRARANPPSSFKAVGA